MLNTHRHTLSRTLSHTHKHTQTFKHTKHTQTPRLGVKSFCGPKPKVSSLSPIMRPDMAAIVSTQCVSVCMSEGECAGGECIFVCVCVRYICK